MSYTWELLIPKCELLNPVVLWQTIIIDIIPLWVKRAAKKKSQGCKKNNQIQPAAKPSQGCINIDELNITCLCSQSAPGESGI